MSLIRSTHPDPMQSLSPDRATSARLMLAAGLVAGPVYVGVSLGQALTRPGFDLTRHAWSVLANGDLGWVQRTNLFVTGALVGLVGVGLRRVLNHGPGSWWAPRGLLIFGAGMIVASVFAADPSLGFPPGTPEDYRGMSGSGIAHMASASIGFIGAVTACFALARRFRANGERGWTIASALVGGFFIASFLGLSGTASSPGVIAFSLAVVAVFAWIAAVSERYRRALT